jgi:type IV pilus assembly protein PilM
MMDFLTLQPKAFGLDISDLSLKIIKLKEEGRGFHVASFGEAPLSPGIIVQGEIRDQKALVKELKEAFAKLNGEKLDTKYVVASLPEEKAFLQVIQMPKMDQKELEKAVPFEAENYIPLPMKEIYLDFECLPPIKENRDHVDVVITAVPKRIVDSYVSCLKEAGLRPVALEVESFAIARALVKGEKTEVPLLILDLGETRTGLSIFSGTSLKFTVSIPVSARQFSEAIAKQLKIELNRADELKREYGLGKRREKEGREVANALLPPLTELVGHIKKYLEYSKTHSLHEHLSNGEKGVAKVYLCGGGANLIGLSSFLSSELKLPVELGNPWVNIFPEPSRDIPEIPYEKALAYTTALGLALRGVNS